MCLMIHLGEHQDHTTQHAPAQPAGAATSDELFGILKHRYALGEITQEQFEEMQRVLGLSAGGGAAPSQSHHAHYEVS